MVFPFFVAVFIAATLVDATVIYIVGRIVLPEVGLTAMPYHVAFWAAFFMSISAGVAIGLKKLLDL